MSQVQAYVYNELNLDRSFIEQIILSLGDAFDIRVQWDKDIAVLTGVCAIAGGLVGGYVGGKMGAALGAGLGGATGLGVSTMVSLREIWSTVKEKLAELFYIVINYLRRLDPIDYLNAFDALMACRSSRRELVLTMLHFIGHKLGKEVVSSITAA